MSDPKHTAVTVIERAEPRAIMHPLVAAAMQTGSLDPATLKELLAVQRDWEAGEAKKAFTRALVALKKDLPASIARDQTVDFTNSAGRCASGSFTSIGKRRSLRTLALCSVLGATNFCGARVYWYAVPTAISNGMCEHNGLWATCIWTKRTSANGSAAHRESGGTTCQVTFARDLGADSSMPGRRPSMTTPNKAQGTGGERKPFTQMWNRSVFSEPAVFRVACASGVMWERPAVTGGGGGGRNDSEGA